MTNNNIKFGVNILTFKKQLKDNNLSPEAKKDLQGTGKRYEDYREPKN